MGSSEPPQAASLLSPPARRWGGPLLLLLGLECLLILSRGDYGSQRQHLLLIGAFLLACVPQMNRPVARALDAWRISSRRTRVGIAMLITIAASIYLPFTAARQERDFSPTWQDEQSYAIQIEMLSHGRLWMPASPLPDFFDTFQMLVKPVYASMYFPGASLFFVPAKWLSIPYWIVSCAMAGSCVGLIFWLASELIDNIAGIMAALLLIGLQQFRMTSIMLFGHPAINLLTLLMLTFWLAWRRDRGVIWAILLSFVSGWAAITRPLDAMIVAIPIGIDILATLARHRPRRILLTMASLILPACPFLMLQLFFNVGVTRSPFQTPFGLHADLYYPGTSFGFHSFDPNHRPASVDPQKQKFHDVWTVPAIQRHQPDKVLGNWLNGDLADLTSFTLPQAWLLLLLPIGLIGLVNRERIAVGSLIPIWIVCYTFYTFQLPHYSLLIAPAMILVVLFGVEQLQNCWPTHRRMLNFALTAAVLSLALTSLPELARHIRDEVLDASELRTIDRRLASLPPEPAVVLFRAGPQSPPAVEPVYNLNVTWPDDAAIVRAHDLGDRNIEIFQYYAQHQPQRVFYLYDRSDGSLKRLGRATELAHGN